MLRPVGIVWINFSIGPWINTSRSHWLHGDAIFHRANADTQIAANAFFFDDLEMASAIDGMGDCLMGCIFAGDVTAATFTGAVTFYLISFASIRLPAAKVLAYGYLVPVIVIVMEGLAGHGWASMTVLVGAIVIVMGLVILVVSPDE